MSWANVIPAELFEQVMNPLLVKKGDIVTDKKTGAKWEVLRVKEKLSGILLHLRSVDDPNNQLQSTNGGRFRKANGLEIAQSKIKLTGRKKPTTLTITQIEEKTLGKRRKRNSNGVPSRNRKSTTSK